jgi:hypothetical protein
MPPAFLKHRFLSLACMSLLLAGCQLPEDGVGVTVRRAQAANGAELYSGGSALNVPMRASEINQVARMLAGMETSGGGSRDGYSWPYHQKQMDALWRRYDEGRGQKIRAWAGREISDLQRYRSVFYPFSGPDFLYAQDLFPSAETYILCGLESAEPLPDFRSLTAGEVAIGLNGLRQSLDGIVNAGYFVTTDMRSDFQSTRLRGTLPILLVFLARSGAQVESVDVVQLDASGTPVLAAVTSGSAPGLMIRFRNGMGGLKRLFYFRQDLSNGSTRLGGPFLTFVAKQGTPPAMVKSASYLMHNSDFSNIRQYLLRSTPGIVQDPSGVPYRDLVGAGLAVDLYGRYQGTLDIFSQQQPDLMAAYGNGQHRVQALDFGYGYLYRASSTSIMVARRR